jgi:hypothetical protein
MNGGVRLRAFEERRFRLRRERRRQAGIGGKPLETLVFLTKIGVAGVDDHV